MLLCFDWKYQQKTKLFDVKHLENCRTFALRRIQFAFVYLTPDGFDSKKLMSAVVRPYTSLDLEFHERLK